MNYKIQPEFSFRFLTIAMASRLYGLSRWKISQAIKRGDLQATKHRRITFIIEQHLIDYLSRTAQPAKGDAA